MPDPGPQTYRRKALEVQAIQYTAETCEAVQALLGHEQLRLGSRRAGDDLADWIERQAEGE